MAQTLDIGLRSEIEDFLFREAHLLDSMKYREWLELFTDDIRYRVPTAETRQGSLDRSRDDSLFVGYLDEDKEMLRMRVRQLDTGLRHVEIPASVTCRLVSNVVVDPVEGSDELAVLSNFRLLQIRHGTHKSEFNGRREDRLRRVGGEWKIAKRTVLLAEAVMPRSISVFF